MSAEKILKFVQRYPAASFECVHEKTDEALFTGESADNIEEFASRVWEQISEDATLLRGLQVYVLRAKRDNKTVARLLLNHESDAPFHSLDQGKREGFLLAQLMRHNEKLGGMLIQMSKLNQPFGQDFYMERAAQFFKKESELEEARQTMARKDREDKRAEEQHKFRLDAQKELFDTSRLLLPSAINALVGKQVLAEKSSPAYLTLAAVAKTITPTQLQLLGAVLDPAQNLALLEFMRVVQEEERKREAPNERE